jgi:hypothetical protein
MLNNVLLVGTCGWMIKLIKRKKMGRPLKADVKATALIQLVVPPKTKVYWQRLAKERGITLTDLIVMGVGNSVYTSHS